MSLTAPDLPRSEPPAPVPGEDEIVVTCGACNTRQHASGRARGFTCTVCGSEWRVLRCRGCRSASIVLAGVRTCPRCGHHHSVVRGGSVRPEPSWLMEPEPLSVWLGGVKYLGGHAARDRTEGSAGLLLDRRGIHLRAFAELFTIRWETVLGLDIEGPLDIADRLTMTRLLELGASTWAMQVAYLTVRTQHGDAIFEISGLAPPELHARLSRVLQGLQRNRVDAESSPAIPIERPVATAPTPPVADAPPVSDEPAVTRDAVIDLDREVATPAPAAAAGAITVDPERSEAPLEAIVVDALWKLDQIHARGIVDDAQVAVLRDRLLARIPALGNAAGNGSGPLLRV